MYFHILIFQIFFAPANHRKIVLNKATKKYKDYFEQCNQGVHSLSHVFPKLKNAIFY